MVVVLQHVTHLNIPNRSFNELSDNVNSIVSISETCGLLVINHWARAAKAELDRLDNTAAQIELTGESFEKVKGALGRLKDGVVGEAQTRFALMLTTKERDLWEPPIAIFGQKYKDNFQSSQYDLDEAAKCLALSRSTASVFHLMRITESGLRAIHQCLGIKVPLTGNNRNWGSILGRIRDEVQNRGNKWTKKDTFQEQYALLDAVKDAWRNPGLHIDKKYTQDEAEHIFAMVRGWMTKLVDCCDENGEPNA